MTEGYVESVAFSPDSRTIAAGYCGGGVVLWDAATRTRRGDAPLAVGEGDVKGVTFSPDSRTIAAGYRVRVGDVVRGGVVLWDAATRTRLVGAPLPVTKGYVESVAFSPDSRTIAAGYGLRVGDVGGGVVLWDAVNRTRQGDPLRVTEGYVESMAFSPDGGTIAAGYGGPGFDLRLMPVLNDVSGIPTEGKNLIIVTAVNNVLHFRIFDSDGKMAVDTDEESLTEQAQQIEDLRKQLKSLWPPHEITWSEKNRIITAVTSIVGYNRARGGVVLWDAATRTRRGDAPLAVGEGDVRGVAFSPDSGTIAAGYGVPGFDLRLMPVLNDVSGIPTEGKNLIIVTAVNNVLHFRIFDSDGKMAVDTDEESLTEQAQQIEDLRKQLKSLWPPHEITWSEKNRIITAVTSIVGYNRARGGVVLWDAATRTRRGDAPLAVGEGDVRGVAFSPDSGTIAAGYGVPGFDLRLMPVLNDVSGIPTEGKNLIIVTAVNNVLHFRIFDSDGKMAVDTDEESLTEQAQQIEDLRKQLKSLWPPHEITWSEKNRIITAVTSIVGYNRARGGVVLWDAATRTRRGDAPLAVGEGDVRGVAFSPDSGTIAAGYGVPGFDLRLMPVLKGVIAPVPGIMRLFWAFSSSNPPESPSQEDSSPANMLDTLEARCRSDGPPAGPRSIDPLPGSRSFLTVSAVA